MFKLISRKEKKENTDKKEELWGVLLDDEEELMIIYDQEKYGFSCGSCPLRGLCGG